jgi:uncharacterized protein YpmS
VSWWMWAIVAWLVVSVPFAVFTAKFIVAGREEPAHSEAPPESEELVDLVAVEEEEAAEAAARVGTERPKRVLRTN